MPLYTLAVPNCYCRRRENVLCGQRSDSFQPRGLLLHNGPSILPHDCAKSDCARSCIHSEFSLQEEPCHCTSCFEQQVRSSLSLSLSLFFEVAIKNGGGEGRCVVSSACRLNLSGKGTCKLTQLIMKQTSKLSSVICKVRIRSQQTNYPLLSPDKHVHTRARAHTHTHTLRFFMAHVSFSNISYTYFCFSSLYFCSYDTVFHSFQAVQTGSVSTNSNTALCFLQKGSCHVTRPGFRLLLDARA